MLIYLIGGGSRMLLVHWFFNGFGPTTQTKQRKINIFMVEAFILLTKPKGNQYFHGGSLHFAYKTKGKTTFLIAGWGGYDFK